MRPEGYVVMHGASAYQDTRTRAVLLATESPRPYDQVRREVESGVGQWTGYRREPAAQFGPYTGSIYRWSDESGADTAIELLAIFGDDKGTITANGKLTSTMDAQAEETLRRAMLTIRWEPGANPIDSLPFSVQFPKSLALCAFQPHELIITVGWLKNAPKGSATLKVWWQPSRLTVVAGSAFVDTTYGPGSLEATEGIDRFTRIDIDGLPSREVVRTREIDSQTGIRGHSRFMEKGYQSSTCSGRYRSFNIPSAKDTYSRERGGTATARCAIVGQSAQKDL